MTIKNKYVKTPLGNKMMSLLDWVMAEQIVWKYATLTSLKDYARGSCQIKPSEVEDLVKKAIEIGLIKIKDEYIYRRIK